MPMMRPPRLIRPPQPPATTRVTPPARPTQQQNTAPRGTAVAPQANPTPTLEDYIRNNFLYTQRMNENERTLQDFDAGTLKGRQDTEADQGKRRINLRTQLDDAGEENAGDFASRGLLRSGLLFQAQDRIDAAGAEQGNLIDQLMSDFIAQREQQRLAREQENRRAQDKVVGDLTQQYNSTVAI